MTTDAWTSPITLCASAHALGLIPSIERMTTAVARKSRQFANSALGVVGDVRAGVEHHPQRVGPFR